MSFRTLTYGENYIRCGVSIHAEEDSINKLPNITKEGKIKKVSLLSIRINRLGKLTTAKPCFRCIHNIEKSIDKGYKIENIYYSEADGSIVKSSLKKLTSEKMHIPSIYRSRAPSP
jgi:hypothetical protein